MTMANLHVSYISAVYNKADVLEETLSFLRNQDGVDPTSVEFVFSDDASGDQSQELLRAEAAKDPRIKLISNQANAGPAIRFNQAAEVATGTYLLPVDADDILPGNATSRFLSIAKQNNVALVFGKSKRGIENCAIAEDANVIVAKDALAFCARKQLVHMGFLTRAELWREAGGADPEIFIQDQSLPMRLSAKAARLAYIEDVVYWLRPAGAENLSRNVAQQHHDRFFSAWAHMKDPSISNAAKQALMRQIVSTVWKLKRDGSAAMPYVSSAFFRYLLNRIASIGMSNASLAKTGDELLKLPNIRRPGAGA